MQTQTEPLATLPLEPGVYLFRDRTGEILYIGKARHLRRRVRSYFCTRERSHFKTRAILQRVSRVDALVVRTEREALLLEAELIKAHRPRYNRRLKDSRGYPFLEIALHHPVPRVSLTYRALERRAVYFGPVPEAGAIRDALQVIRRLYTLRRESFDRNAPDRTAADHRRMARQLLALLEGRSVSMKTCIERAMRAAAGTQDFERAARLRAALAAIESLAHQPHTPATTTTTADPRLSPCVLARITVAFPSVPST